MRLLDCGCGTGSITVGLAQFVAPGQVVAIDNREEAIEQAKSLAEDSEVDNIRFERGDIYELAFADGDFDAVFCHAVVEHLSEPVAALEEMYRVLKTGGVAGVRSIDLDGTIFAPEDPLYAEVLSLVDRLIRHHGSNFKIGKHLRSMLNSSGFARVQATASYDSYGMREAIQAWTQRGISEFSGNFGAELIRQGLADRETVERIAAAYEAWMEDPGTFYARPWCEAVGWKE
jgi:ubiquinone/menaquinone biosynthesis C-methylase UbiE